MDKKGKLLVIICCAIIICSTLIIFVCRYNRKENKVTLVTQEKIVNKTGHEISKVTDYLYEITYNDYDFVYATNYFNENYRGSFGACSSVRKGYFYGRNYDWNYDEKAEFIIRTTANENRHASIGVAQGVKELTNNYVSSLESSNEYNILPYFTLDGINDAGLVVNINVVPTGDNGYTTGTNPDKEDLNTIMIVRYLLDNASSVDEAIELLNNRNIYTPLTDNFAQEFHYMIADSNKTVVVEFVNNKMVVLDNENILTNYYLSTDLTEHAMGLERYNILKDNYENINTMDDMINLMKKVYYTNAYNLFLDKFWYSEFVLDYGENSYGNLTINDFGEESLNGDISKAGKYENLLTKVQELYSNKTRDGKTWQTVHSSVYDIENKKLSINIQENSKQYEFSLN